MEADEKQFLLKKADLGHLKRLEVAFRSFLTLPDIAPEDIVGLARAIRVVQRLPLSTPNIDVSVSLGFRTKDYVASSTVRLSSERIEAEGGAASRVVEGEYEFESFPGFNFTVDLDGEYESEGGKREFFDGFVLQPEALMAEGYSITVSDNSDLGTLPPYDEEDSAAGNG